MGIVSNNAQTLQNVASVDDFLNVAATETVPLFEHLEFEFLEEYDVFAHSDRSGSIQSEMVVFCTSSSFPICVGLGRLPSSFPISRQSASIASARSPGEASFENYLRKFSRIDARRASVSEREVTATGTLSSLAAWAASHRRCPAMISYV